MAINSSTNYGIAIHGGLHLESFPGGGGGGGGGGQDYFPYIM